MRPDFKKAYYLEHDIYNNMIESAKDKSWQKVCEMVRKNPFTLPYKIARDQIKQRIILTSMKKDDGEMTKSLEETVHYVLDKLYPIANEEHITETEKDKQRKETDQIPGTKTQDKLFTQLELNIIITNLRKDVTPGPDDLNTILIQEIYKAHKKFFLN